MHASEGVSEAGTRPTSATEGRLPNLVIIGVAKAGTTSLFSYLAQHPEICGSDVKELRYFTPLRFGGELASLEDYAAHFAHCSGQPYALEATPGYFYGGRALARSLHQTLPGARVVLILRAPGERCWSWFRFVKMRLNLAKDTSFDEYLDRCEELYRAGVDTTEENFAYWGLGGGCYDLYLDDWVKEFGDRLRIVFFEDLGREPAQTVRDLCRWLDIDESVVSRFDFPVENKTQQYRVEGLQRLAMQVNRRSERLIRGHSGVKRWLRSAYYRVNHQASDEAFTPAVRSRLADFYRPHNARLAEQMSALSVPLPAWLSEVHRG